MSDHTTTTSTLEAALDAAASDPVNLMVHRHGDAYYAMVEGRLGHLGRGSTAEDALEDLRASLAGAS